MLKRSRAPDAVSAFTRVFDALWQRFFSGALQSRGPSISERYRSLGSRLCAATLTRCSASGTREPPAMTNRWMSSRLPLTSACRFALVTKPSCSKT